MSRIIQHLFAAVLLGYSTFTVAACPPTDNTLQDLLQLKANQWQIADTSQRQHTALKLLDCLSNPDPQLRDEIGFEALSFWLRGELLNVDTIQQIRQQLLQELSRKSATPQDADNTGYAQPFAALVLAEVARVDRRKAFMSAAQRQEIVSAAAQYLAGVSDFRGFDERTGWRHGVAHGADWMMQLSLNPALNKTQHETMLTALASQIRNDQHFYQYGESERLMTPVFYLGLRSALTNEEWEAWFSSLFVTNLDLKKTTQASLARKHNLNAFFSAMYLNLQESKQVALQEKILPILIKSLKKLN